MTRQISTPRRATPYLLALWFLPTAYAQCVQTFDGETRCFDKKTPLTVVAIAGIVLGVIVLLSIGAVIFAVVRYRRNRKFQRTYVQNAQANANANNVVPPAYPPMAHVGQPHTQHMQPHNQALEQHNQAGNLVQNQAAYQSNAYTTPTAGIGGVSGYTV